MHGKHLSCTQGDEPRGPCPGVGLQQLQFSPGNMAYRRHTNLARARAKTWYLRGCGSQSCFFGRAILRRYMASCINLVLCAPGHCILNPINSPPCQDGHTTLKCATKYWYQFRAHKVNCVTKICYTQLQKLAIVFTWKEISLIHTPNYCQRVSMWPRSQIWGLGRLPKISCLLVLEM